MFTLVAVINSNLTYIFGHFFQSVLAINTSSFRISKDHLQVIRFFSLQGETFFVSRQSETLFFSRIRR
jgi:hypothetical protein